MPLIGDLQDSYLTLLEDKKTSIKVPGKDAKEDEITAYWSALGRPEKPDGYKFEEAKLPEGLSKDEDLEKAFKELSHSMGLTNEQAAANYDFYNNIMAGAFNAKEEHDKQVLEETEKARIKRDEELKVEWGADYEPNKELMSRAMKTFGGEEIEKVMDSVEYEGVKLGNHPVIIKSFVNIGKAMAEDTLLEGQPAGGKEDTEEERLKERYPEMVEAGIPYHQDLKPKVEPDEDLKARYPDMKLEDL